MEKDKSLKNERQKQNYEAMDQLEKRARNTAKNLELQKKGTNNPKQWIQRRISTYYQMICQKLLIFVELM